MMRPDLFQDRKGIHSKIEKSIHAALRGVLFRYHLSMQEVFEECARLIVDGDNRMLRVLDELVKRKIEAQIEGVKRIGHLRQEVDELEHDALYSLIEDNEISSNVKSNKQSRPWGPTTKEKTNE